MRIAIISDVHGNYPALSAVIDDARGNDVDRFIFLGDYIFDLPFSNEVTRLIMQLENADVIKGNKEAALYRLSKENQQEWTSKQLGGIYQTFRELPPDVFDYLVNLQDEMFIPIEGHSTVYASHIIKEANMFMGDRNKHNCGSANFHKNMLKKPFTHEEYLAEFSEMLTQKDIRNAINSIDASVILFGHNHLQCYGYCDGKLIINPGSCGQPLDFKNDAPYTILELTANGYNVIEKRVRYDIEEVISYAKKSQLYKEGTIWSELVFLAMRTGRDYFGIFFETANHIAESKGEKGQYYSNDTWEEAYSVFSEGRSELH